MAAEIFSQPCTLLYSVLLLTRALWDQKYWSKVVYSRPPGWRSGLEHCIAECHQRRAQALSQPATHNCPSVVRVREGLAGRDILVSSRTSDSCGGPGAVHADQVARCFLRHIGAAGFRVGCALCRPSSLLSSYGSCSDETRLNFYPLFLSNFIVSSC